MSALAKDRNTKRMNDSAVCPVMYVPVKAAKLIYKGSIVCIDSGYAEPGVTATGLKAVGCAEDHVDNSSGASGDLSCRVRRGTFKFANLGADPVVAAGLFTTCYVSDDQTVAATDGTGTRSAAGLVVQLDSDGVWVELGNYAQAL